MADVSHSQPNVNPNTNIMANKPITSMPQRNLNESHISLSLDKEEIQKR